MKKEPGIGTGIGLARHRATTSIMPTMGRNGWRAVVVVLIAVELALCLGLLAWRVGSLGERGWAGLAYMPAGLGGLGAWPGAGLEPGRVLLVAPGSPSERSGLRPGDRILAVNEVPVEQLGALVGLGRSLAPADPVVYRLQRDGEPYEVRVALGSAFSSAALLAAVVSSLLTGLAFLLVPLPAAWRRPHSSAAVVLFLTSAVAAALFFAAGLVAPVLPDLAGLAPLGAEPLGAGFIPLLLLLSLVLVNLLLHLALVFPCRRPVLERWPEVVVWVHTLPLLPWAVTGILISGLVAVGPVAWAQGLGAVTLLAVVAVRLARRRGDLGLWRAVLASPWSSQAALAALVGAAAPLLGLARETVQLGVMLVVGLAATGLCVGLILAWTVLTGVVLHRGHRDADSHGRSQARRVVRGATFAFVASVLFGLAALALPSILGHGGAGGVLCLVCVASSQLVWVLLPLSFASALGVSGSAGRSGEAT